MSDAEEKKIAELERELRGTQEMLFLVLNAVGEPVEVTDEMMTRAAGDRMIDIQQVVERNVWVFSVKEIS